MKSAPSRPVGEAARVGLGQLDEVVGAQLAVAAEVAALGDLPAVDRRQAGGERARIERGDDVPVLGGDERHPLALALDDEPRGDRLDAPGRQALHHLAPEDRRDLVAVEAVEDAAGLLRVDQALVDLARLGERALDRGARDLVEDHAPHGNRRLQHLHEVPGDRLALAILVCREQQLVGALQLGLQIGDDLLLARVDDVERLELLVDVDAQARPGLALQRGGDLGGRVREVADVPDRRLDHVAVAQVARDRLRLGRRLDDHETPSILGFSCCHRRATIAP